MKKPLFIVLAFWLFAIGMFSQGLIKDKTFDLALKNLYNPAVTDLGWSSYTAYPTTGTPNFTSSVITEANGNKYYQCVTTTTSDTYQRVLSQFTSQPVIPARYKLSFRAKAADASGSFYLKLSAQSALSTLLPANMSDATPGVALSGGKLIFTPTTEWQTYSCVFDMFPAAEEYVRVYFTFNNTGTYEMDDVDLIPYGNTAVASIDIAGTAGRNTISTSLGSLQLTANVLPSNATYKKVTWSVDDNRIATINANGLITAIQDGTVTAYATALDGSKVEGSYTVTITNNPLVQKINVSGKDGVNAIATAGGTLQMMADILPANAADKRISWSVDKPAYATIDQNGLLTAKVNGQVVVTALAVDLSGVSGSDTVTITGNAVNPPSERLASRFTYFHNDSLVSYLNSANWATTISMRNKASYKSTTTAGDYVQYTPNFLGMSGNVDILIFKNTCTKTLNSRAKVEVFHNGKSDIVYTNLNSVRDMYYSIGKFDFSGKGNEYVRIWHENTATAPTPAMPVRMDVYYDTKMRVQTAEEISASVVTGYSKTGTWRNSTKAGYRAFATPQESNTAGSVAIWKPGKMDAGKYMIYVYRPNEKTDDKYEIYHDSKVEEVYLKNMIHSNWTMDTKTGSPCNPTIDLGWRKLGVFEFTGNGNEFVRLTKNSSDTTFTDCLMFENVQFDGTILRRTVVTTNPYNGGLYEGAYPATFEQKQAAAGIQPGLSMQGGDVFLTVSTGLYNGSTVYSREYVLGKGMSVPHYINPLITEPGEYEVSLYAGYPPGAGSFSVITGAGTKPFSVASFPQYKFTSIGKATFNGGLNNEYVQFNLPRFSDMLFEKNISNGAILKQVAVTAFPYYSDKLFADTKGIPAAHDISVMVKKGYLVSIDANTFAPNRAMTRGDFTTALAKIMSLTSNTFLPNFSDVLSTDPNRGYIASARKAGVLYGLPDSTKLYPNEPITREAAAQMFLNAMEIAGRFTNVKNYLKTTPAVILRSYADGASVSDYAKEALACMVEARVIKPVGVELQPAQTISRANAASLLKLYKELILSSGPSYRKCDWTMTFEDEFDGNMLNYDKWSCDDYVRFAPFSAKWKENCMVEDGMFKGYNFFDNHKVPFSSGNITSRFSQNRGFFDARYKYPKCFGSHTSFWSSGGSAGDNNYNEGAYPNSVGTNNYFLKSPRAFDFETSDDLSADFHTNGGYTGVDDIFYTWDGKTYGIVTPLSDKWNTVGIGGITKGATTANYPAQLSTVISWFDGPMDRDQIDGTFAACDWIRIYREIVWLPELQPASCMPAHQSVDQPVNVSPVLKFNKAMNLSTLTTANIAVVNANGGAVPTYRIEQVTPLRYRIRFNSKLDLNTEYKVTIKSVVKDAIGNAMVHDTLYSFKTQSFAVLATCNGPVATNAAIQLNAVATGGSGSYTSYEWTGPNGYTSKDQNPSIVNATVANAGIYTVKVTDSNGATSSASVFVLVSLANGITQTEMNSKMVVYPNPCKGMLTVSDPELSYNNALVRVVNMAGQIVMTEQQQANAGKLELNLSELKNGIYFLHLKADGKDKFVRIMMAK